MPIIDIEETLDASGGENDAVGGAYSVRTDSAAVHLVVGGATTDLAFHMETRLADGLGYEDWISPRTGLSNGYADVWGVDIGDLTDIRVRAVNQDANNQADVRIVVDTGGA